MPALSSGDGAVRPADLALSTDRSGDRLGIAIVGLGGAVATTMVAGVELIRQRAVRLDGLPLAALDHGLTASLAPYEGLVFGGWDLYDGDLAAAAQHHGVLDLRQYDIARDALAEVTPWPAYGDARFCAGVTGTHTADASGLRAAVDGLRQNLRDFKATHGLDRAVVINLASTEASPDLSADVFQTAAAFEAAVDANDERISPAMLYAYAGILEGCPYGNFTPSVGADVPALIELAEREGVPLAGKDGKTGQTFVKTVLAPGLRDRALTVEGWFSTNILGNRDGEALREAGSLASKIGTKGSVLDQILGYEIEDHVVKINYYKPRGDAKEAWDNVDLVGFLGERMQLKVNFLCKDSILAAPLAIDIARCLDLARRSGRGGVMEPMGVFFKGPMTRDVEAVPEHDFARQQAAFLDWLGGLGETADVDATVTATA
ncbi:MAG: inositol-3-phosphate synthase [Bacteroidota bacterium]